MTAIKLALSRAGVARAKKELEEYSAEVIAKTSELCRRLGGLGVDIAKAAVRVDTGTLKSGIYAQEDGPARWLVVATGAYAAFVEFGTGVVGEGTYPADVPVPWEYDSRQTPAAHDPEDPTRWYYFDPADAQTHSTRGQTANAYMATAADAMREAVWTEATEVFG